MLAVKAGGRSISDYVNVERESCRRRRVGSKSLDDIITCLLPLRLVKGTQQPFLAKNLLLYHTDTSKLVYFSGYVFGHLD